MSKVCTDPQAFIKILHQPGDVFEVRAYKCPDRPGSRWTATAAGFFRDYQKAQHGVNQLHASMPPGIYCTINPVRPDLLARSANCINMKAGSTTRDDDIVRRRWLFLDIDPVRPSGVSSTAAEMQAGLDLASDISAELVGDYRWPLPLTGMSGNGAYLLFRIDLPNDDASRTLVKELLRRFALHFDNEHAKVDPGVYNASQGCKVLGTIARKGSHLEGEAGIDDRPHRKSWFYPPVGDVEVVPVELLQAALEWLPDTAETTAGASSKQPAPVSSGQINWLDIRRQITDSVDVVQEYAGWGARFTRSEANGKGSIPCHALGREDGTASACVFMNGTNRGAYQDSSTGEWLSFFDAAAAFGGFTDWQAAQTHYAAMAGVELPGRKSATTLHKTAAEQERSGNNGLPMVELPGGEVTVSSASLQLGRLFAGTGLHFSRGGVFVRIRNEDDATICRDVPPAQAVSEFETVGKLGKVTKAAGEDEPSFKPKTCSESGAKAIIHSTAFVEELPKLVVISRCPVLVEQSGELIEVHGYDRNSGVYADGEQTRRVELPAAVSLLQDLLADFNFASEPDRSRALAAIITPALVMGGLLGGRPPIDLGEADKSQTGKGYRNKLTAAIYRCNVATITQSTGRGVGSLEEAFSHKLRKGVSFIAVDNVRGKLDSPAIESFLTEDTYTARAPYCPQMDIDTRRVVVMLTSNAAEITPDLANRMSCVRLLKQSAGYQFQTYEAGGLLEHVRAKQAEYLGAVFAIVRAWWQAGRSRTNETRHDFRPWAGTLDWIVQNLFSAAPLLDGHQATQQRMTSPNLNWLRDVALKVANANRLEEALRANEILDLLDHTEVFIPGVKDRDMLDDDETREKAMRGIGRRLSGILKDKETVIVDSYELSKTEVHDELRRAKAAYRFSLSPQ